MVKLFSIISRIWIRWRWEITALRARHAIRGAHDFAKSFQPESEIALPRGDHRPRYRQRSDRSQMILRNRPTLGSRSKGGTEFNPLFFVSISSESSSTLSPRDEIAKGDISDPICWKPAGSDGLSAKSTERKGSKGEKIDSRISLRKCF